MDKPAAQMPPSPTAPRRLLPANAVDTHVHLLAAPHEFPLWEGRVENPAPGPDLDGWLAMYRAHLSTLGCTRGVLVHSIFYGTDNSVTVESLRRLGRGFKGVGLLPDGAGEDLIDQFMDWNMVAVRLNYVHGGVLTWDGAKTMAPALAERGMHIQMLAHADRHLEEIADDIRALPCPVVFDHLGWPADGLNPGSAGFRALCEMLSEGHAYVKLSGPYRVCNAPYDEADACIQALLSANPDRCLWGSDWPHIMLNGAQMPQASEMLDALDALIPDDGMRRKVFVDNPAALYRF